MIARWFTSFRVLIVWLLGFALALVILMLWHELLMAFIVNTLLWGKYTVNFIHVLYYCIAGLALVAYFTLSKSYLNQSAQKRRMLGNSLKIFGTQLLIIGLSQAGLTLYSFFPADWIGILLMAAEGLAGMGMLFFARHLKGRTPKAGT